MLFFLVGTEFSACQCPPRGDGHAFRCGSTQSNTNSSLEHIMSLAHRNYLSLEGAIHDIPRALVNHERRLTMITSVLIRLSNYP